MPASENAIALARLAAVVADDKKGEQIIAFDVSDQLTITDLFLIIGAANERRVGAIVDAVEEQIFKEYRLHPARREGDRENRWVLLDYVDVVVHVQHAEERQVYSLERLWKDCPLIDLGLAEAAAGSVGEAEPVS